MTKAENKPLAGYEVLLCVTGGIACYKSASLLSRLVQSGAGVSVAMTKRLSLTATVSHRYDSDPGPGLKKSDVLFITGVSFRID